MDCDEEPAFLRRVADGELHLACGVCVVGAPEDTTKKTRKNKPAFKLKMKKGKKRSHGEGISLSDVKMRGNPSGNDIISADFTVGIPAARDQLSVQDLQRPKQHSR